MDIRMITLGQTVFFDHHGKTLSGKVARINTKTVSLDSGCRVTPGLLASSADQVRTASHVNAENRAKALAVAPHVRVGDAVRLGETLSPARWRGATGVVLGFNRSKIKVKTDIGTCNVPAVCIVEVLNNVAA